MPRKKTAKKRTRALRKAARQLSRKLGRGQIGLAVADPDIARDLASVFRDAGFEAKRDADGVIHLIAPDVPADEVVRRMNKARRKYVYRLSGRLEP